MHQDEIQAAADETLRIIQECGCIIENDHFVHISGLHLNMWLNKDAIFPHVRQVQRLTHLLARRVVDQRVELVCGPAIGGLVVSEWLAHELGAMCAFAEHDPAPAPGELRGRFVLRRGYDQLVSGRRVLVVDDAVTTGHSIREVIEAVRAAGGKVVAGASLIFTGNFAPEALGLDAFFYLYHFPRPPMWKASECPLCRDGVPINTRFGHGAEFVAAQQND